jgi:Mn2+/Fe2+ NRAMP family transporter
MTISSLGTLLDMRLLLPITWLVALASSWYGAASGNSSSTLQGLASILPVLCAYTAAYTAVRAACRESVDIADAYKLLSPTLGAKAASIIFALALLASGQNSTITGTLAGQVVCEGAQKDQAQHVWSIQLPRRWVPIAHSSSTTCVRVWGMFVRLKRQCQTPLPRSLLCVFPSGRQFWTGDMKMYECNPNTTAQCVLPPVAAAESHAGFLDLKMRPVYRRLLTRAVAVLPALVVAIVMGDKAVGQLLVISQVILSMQLPFAVFPLVHFTSLRKYTGRYANGYVSTAFALVAALVIAALNIYLLVSVMRDPTALSGSR